MATTVRQHNARLRGLAAAIIALGSVGCATRDSGPEAPLAAYSLAADGGIDATLEPEVERLPEPAAPTEMLPLTFGSVAACDTAWGNLTRLATATEQSTTGLSATVANGQLCVLVSGSSLETGKFNLFIESDARPQTGLQPFGSDYLFDQNGFRKHIGPDFNWDPRGGADVGYARSAGELRLRVATASLESDSAQQSIGLTFQHLIPDTWNQQSLIPTTGKLVRTAKPACRPVQEHTPVKCMLPPEKGSAPEFGVSSGMLIPAYLRVEPNDATWAQSDRSWKDLADGAKLVTDDGQDYWVAVSGPDRGPFVAKPGMPATLDDWTDAKKAWDPIRVNKGRIFGYVHTCTLDPGQTEVGPHFKPLHLVQEEIAQWVCGYPALDGIWLDEFNPRFELADKSGGVAEPNGPDLAPIDRGNDVDPTCGYYDRLRSWIQRHYPHLRVIGNAGGSLRSNQFQYGKLVDVLVTVEESLTNARGVDGLTRADRTPELEGTVRYGALVHGVAASSDMKSILGESFAAGYSHVYATDIVYDDTTSNVWGFLPTDGWAKQEGLIDPGTGVPTRPSFLLEVDEFVKR